MKYEINLYLKGTNKDSIATSLAKLAKISDMREYTSKEKALISRKNYPTNRNAIISVEQIKDDTYIIKLSKKSMSSLLENIILKYLSREIRINNDVED
jgi:tartrate dehydratase alpha subunit/fumarate hydratase class I-like protein